MILRSSALRHGRQLLCAPSRRALATDNRPTFTLPTAYADPPPPPPPPFNPSAAAADAAAPQAIWEPPKLSPLALWNRRKEIKVDPAPALEYRARRKLYKTSGKLGAAAADRFHPRSLLRNPPRPADISLELLMAAQLHMGHHKSLWNPAMQRYIYGVRSEIHVISLEETAAALRRAAKVVEEVAFLGGLILVVGTRKGQMEIVAKAAELAGACHLFTKWTPGMITNRDHILAKEAMKVVDHQDQEAKGFERHLLERRPLMPELVIVLNPQENYTMLHECAQENIPTIGLIDTNGDPTKVTYTIPGNDDSLRAVSVVAGVLGRAGEAGQKRRKAEAKRGVCTWRNRPEIQRWIAQHLTEDTIVTDDDDELVEEDDEKGDDKRAKIYDPADDEEDREQEREYMDDHNISMEIEKALREMEKEEGSRKVEAEMEEEEVSQKVEGEREVPE